MADAVSITAQVNTAAIVSGNQVSAANISAQYQTGAVVSGALVVGAKGDDGQQQISVIGNTAGTAALISSGTMYLAGGNNITLSQSGNTVSINGGAGGGGGGVVLYDGANSISSGTARFSNSNGVSFGFNGQTITASHNGLTSQSVQTQGMVSLNGSTGALSLATASSLSSSSNGSTISIGLASNITTALQSAGAYLTTAAQSNQVINSINGSTGTFSFNTGSSLSSSRVGNAVTWGLASNITTALQSTGNYLTTARASTDAIGLNTAVSNATITANSSGLSFDGRGYAGTGTSATNASITLNSNGLAISVAAGGGGADGYNILAAGTQTAGTATSVKFADSNGISFGMSNSSQITASYSVPSTAGLISAINLSAGTTSNNLSKVTFSDSNGISFGLNGSVITGTVKTDYQSSNANYLTSQSNQALSGSNGSFTFQTATITGSGAAQVYTTNGSSLVVSVPTQTTQPVAVSGQNGSYAFSTLSLSNANGMSFGTSAGSAVTGSYTVPTVTQYFSNTATTFNGTNVSGSLTLNTNGLRVDISAGAGGGVTPVASASNGSFSFTTLGFSNANNVTFGTSAGNIVTASVAAPGAAAENNWMNLLGANTAGNTTASGSTIGLSGVNLTLSGTNGSAINISAPATSSLSATGGLSLSTNGSTISIGYGEPLSRFEYPEGIFTALAQTGMGSLSLNHVYVPFNVTATAMKIGGSLSAATNTSATTASANVSLYMGIYTLNGSTLSLASSGSANNGFAWSQSASSTGNTSINSMRQMTVPINVNMTPGQYWIGALISQQTTYTSYGYTIYGNDRIASAGTNAVLTPIGSNTTANRDVMLFQGIYTAATGALPGAIQGANINNSSASNVQRANFYWAAYNATF